MADEFWKEQDIIDHVKKLSPNIPERKIKAHLRAYIDIIKRMASDEDTLSICLTHVGNVYIKKDRIVSKLRSKECSKKDRAFYKKKLDYISEAEQLSNRRIEHRKKFWLRNYGESRGMSWEEIENKQNEMNGSK